MSGNAIHDNELVRDTRLARACVLIESALDELDNLADEITNDSLEAARVSLNVALDHLDIFNKQL